MKVKINLAPELLECRRGDYVLLRKRNGKILYTQLSTVDSQNAKLINVEHGNRVSDLTVNPLNFLNDIKRVCAEVDAPTFQVVRKEDVEFTFNNVMKGFL